MKQEEYHLIALLYAENFKALYYYAYTIVKDRHVAENLVNDTFLQAIQKSDVILKHENPQGWLRLALKLNLKQYVRAQTRRPATVSLDSTDEKLLAQTNPAEAETLLLTSLKKTLSEEDFRLFTLYYLEGYSHARLAEEFGISVSASQKRLERIRKRLQKVLKEES